MPITALSDIDRFWARVRKTDDCWLWLGEKTHNGYGRFHLGYRRYARAHRFIYEHIHGVIPDGLVLCHRCDNPSCVRPDHLFPGTPKENINDSVAKGRFTRGESQHLAKLTDAKVRTLRQQYADGVCVKALTEIFNISEQTVRTVVKRRTWKHVL